MAAITAIDRHEVLGNLLKAVAEIAAIASNQQCHIGHLILPLSYPYPTSSRQEC